VAAFARDRHPLVAFGANGAPSRLKERFAAFADLVDREVLVLTGELHGVDVGAQASPTAHVCVEDMPALLRTIAPLIWPTAVRLPADQWTPYPGDDGLGRGGEQPPRASVSSRHARA